MKVIELFHPLFGLYHEWNSSASGKSMVIGSGVDFHAGELWFVIHGKFLLDSTILKKKPGNSPRVIFREKDHHPFGIAVNQLTGAFYFSDWKNKSVCCCDENGQVIKSFGCLPYHIKNPGAIAFHPDNQTLLITDRLTNRIVEINPETCKKESEFWFSPAEGYFLRGITVLKGVQEIFVSCISDYGMKDQNSCHLFKLTSSGSLIEQYDTGAIGFTPYDIAAGPENDFLYLMTREYVIEDSIGDHSHIVGINLNLKDTAANEAILTHFIKMNNLIYNYNDQAKEYQSLRWSQLPVSVYIRQNIDLEADTVEGVFSEWVRASEGKLSFEFNGPPSPRGIIIIQDESAYTNREALDFDHEIVISVPPKSTIQKKFPENPEQIQHTILRHEIGHALGFIGHSPRNRIDTMNSAATGSHRISREEGLFMKALYSLPAGSGYDQLEKIIH